MPNFHIGERVRHRKDNSRGSIRYIGTLSSHSHTWIGIEWDSPGRGKHSGTVDNVSYFKCDRGNGSFCREKSLRKGIPFAKAVEERYLVSHEDVPGTVIVMDAVITAPEEVETVSLDKSDVFFQSCEIYQNLKRNGNSQKIGKTVNSQNFPNIRSVSLNDSLVRNWSSILSFAHFHPSLEHLFLDNNSLLWDINKNSKKNGNSQNSQNPEIISCFENLEILSLNGSLPNLEPLIALTPFLGSLTDLCVRNNRLESLSGLELERFGALKTLDLSSNRFSSLFEIPKSGIETLFLNENGICCIETENGNGNGKNVGKSGNPENLGKSEISPFPNISSLSLNRNPIRKLQFVRSLQHSHLFPRLCHLRMQNTPLGEELGDRTLREAVIGLLPQLNTLNRSEISERERKDAEIEFSEKSEKNGISEIPKNPKTIKQRLISLTLVNVQENTRISVKVLKTMSVLKLIGLASRRFKLARGVGIGLVLVSSSNRERMNDQVSSLDFYGVCDGNVIEVQFI